MQSALHITTKVLPGNKVEVQLPPGSEGQEVNVFVVLSSVASPLARRNQDFDLVALASDPEIQAELAAIESEFAIAQWDGLSEK